MKRIFSSKSAFFNPRIFAAFVLVTFAISLGVFSFAGPKSAARKSSRQTVAAFQPTIIQSIFNGESAPIRDMPSAVATKESGEPEHDLPRVKPNHAVPTGDYHECIAISKTPDATGAYYVYDFPLSTTHWQDYPHFGVWPDAYYMTMHQFTPAGDAYLGQAAWAFERDRMLKGQPAQLIYFNLETVDLSFGGQLPSNLDGFTLPPAGAPNYFVQVDSSADHSSNPPNA